MIIEKRKFKILSGLLNEEEYSYTISLPKEINIIFNAFKKHHKKLYIVGGAVRDALMKKTPKDFDLTTDATPEEILSILQEEGIRAFLKGFGVISAIMNDQEFEIAPFRKESYDGGDGRRPTSVEFTDLETDSSRRDFTINALYFDIDKKKIIDLVGGVKDIENNIIRPVGNIIERFKEDKLRVLRFLRFAHRNGSSINQEYANAIIEFNNLDGVSPERIKDEFIKGLISAKNTKSYLLDYQRFGLFRKLFNDSALNTNFINDLRNPKLILANILINKKESEVESDMLTSKYEKDTIKIVIYLIKIYNFFKNFDKNQLIPEVEFDKFKKLYDYRKKINNVFLDENNLKSLSQEEIIEWAVVKKLNENLINKFINFAPKYKALDFPELKGAELGKKIDISNLKYFLDLI
jgi:tRNA nucleotidyltransferase/poly(A) polymerase